MRQASVVLRIKDLKVACGGYSARRSARMGAHAAPPSPVLRCSGGSNSGSRHE